MIVELGEKERNDEVKQIENEIVNQLKLLLMTDEVRAERMTVEQKSKMDCFASHTIWDVVPHVYQDIRLALERYYGRVWKFANCLKI